VCISYLNFYTVYDLIYGKGLRQEQEKSFEIHQNICTTWFKLYCLGLMPHLQGQALLYLALWHSCLVFFMLGDMHAAVLVVYPSCITNVW